MELKPIHVIVAILSLIGANIFLYTKMQTFATKHDDLVQMARVEFCTLGSVENRIGQAVVLKDEKGKDIHLDEIVANKFRCEEMKKILTNPKK